MDIQAAENRTNDLSQDEISVTDLLRKLWQRRGLLVILPVLFLLLAVIFLFITMVKTYSPTVYYINLQGIEKSTYPNGTRFSPQDLLSPEVLERAVKSLNIAVDKDLKAAIQVGFGMPTTKGIQKKFQKQLSSKKLSATDIEQINKNYLDELRRVSERGLKIVVDHSSLGLSKAQGAVLATALPRAWTDIYTKKYRVFVDTRLENVAVVKDDNQLNTTADILVARNTLVRMARGLETISADIRLRSVVSQSGFNSSDLRSQLKRFKEIYFRVIFDEMFANPDDIAKSFITNTRLKIDEINRNIDELNLSLADISSFSPRAAERVLPSRSSEVVQLGDNTLDQVIQLANQASLSDYLQQVLTARRELVLQRSALQTDLNRSKIEFSAQSNEALLSQSQREFSSLVAEYTSLLKDARGTSQRNYGDFYKPLSAPDVVGSILPTRAILILILAIFLGEFFAILLALILPGQRSNID